MAEQKESESKAGKVFDQAVFSRIYDFVTPYKGWFYFLVVLTVLSALVSPLRPALIQRTVDRYIVPGDYDGLVTMVILLIALTLTDALLQFSHTFLSGWLGQTTIRDIRITLYDHILRLRLRFFDRTPIGKLVTRTVSDIQQLSDVFTNGLAAIISDLLQLFFIIFVMLCVDWKLTVISLSAIPLLLLATYVFNKKVKGAFNAERTAVSNLNTFVQERITGMNIVQVFNSEKREYDKFKDINKTHLKANLNLVMYYSIYFPVAEVIGAISTGMLVWYGTDAILNTQERVGIMNLPYITPEDPNITLGVLISFIMYLSMFFRPIRMIADRFNTLQRGLVSSERIVRLLDDHSDVQAPGSHEVAKLQGKVSFKDVWFAYVDDDYVLKDINFEVQPGETIAFVGATGAGKSSIINLLNRFYDINKGQITVDDVPVGQYDLASLREQIGIVLQDVFLFSDTIRHNITLGNPSITDEKLWEAADLVGVREFIERLPGGLDYNVMERGATLSVGQRQLISFVRAMVYNPSILVLDEATSSVDTETEELIQGAIGSMMEGRTAIVIAHRLATIQGADKIIVLDKGEIKESGTHEELLAKGGFYTRLYEMQFAEMEGEQ